MPPTQPVLLHVLDANGAPVAIRSGALVDTLDRSAAIMEFAAGTCAASGDNTVLAAPGSGEQYLVSKLQIHNESTTATTVLVKWGSREVWRVYLPATAGSGSILSFAAPDRMEGRDNQPLLLNLSGANSVGYSVQYYQVTI